MKIGAGISGGAHVALLGFAVFSGLFDQETQATPVAIAEISMMTGTEFEAATSAAPNFDASRVAAPEAPNVAEERADLTLAEADAAPTTTADPTPPETPEQGEDVTTPPEEAERASIADVGDRPAAPLAPEADAIVAPSEPTEELAPEALVQNVPKPAARPEQVVVDTSSPEPEPAPTPEPAPAEAEEPKPDVAEKPDVAPKPEKEPEPEVAEVAPEPENDPTTPAPNVAPPPPKKPLDVAQAKRAERLARPKATPEKTGAPKKAAAPASTASTRTVGRLSSQDKDALASDIKDNFSPNQNLRNADTLFVKLGIRLSLDGKIISGPELLEPRGSLSQAQDFLRRAGVRALKKSAAKGVFSKLPKDRYSRWREMVVIFKPREVLIQ